MSFLSEEALCFLAKRDFFALSLNWDFRRKCQHDTLCSLRNCLIQSRRLLCTNPLAILCNSNIITSPRINKED
uniref:Uncharacterized protein n=1 Tax=Anguilla anguilla TaxID=7936 RepID=A0A0E9XKL2_ANGAN